MFWLQLNSLQSDVYNNPFSFPSAAFFIFLIVQFDIKTVLRTGSFLAMLYFTAATTLGQNKLIYKKFNFEELYFRIYCSSRKSILRSGASSVGKLNNIPLGMTFIFLAAIKYNIPGNARKMQSQGIFCVFNSSELENETEPQFKKVTSASKGKATLRKL